jgi:Tfp pilus assembly protein FimT
LLEIAVTLAIIGIVSSLTVATLREVVLANRERGGAQVLANALRRARAVAINTHSRVRIDTTATGVALSSCASRYGATACAGSSSFTALTLDGTNLGTNNEFVGLSVTPPSSTLIFSPAGFPETVATYTWTVDHPQLPGSRQIVVTGGGEVRVQ